MVWSTAPSVLPSGKVIGGRLLDNAGAIVKMKIDKIIWSETVGLVADGWMSIMKNAGNGICINVDYRILQLFTSDINLYGSLYYSHTLSSSLMWQQGWAGNSWSVWKFFWWCREKIQLYCNLLHHQCQWWKQEGSYHTGKVETIYACSILLGTSDTVYLPYLFMILQKLISFYSPS